MQTETIDRLNMEAWELRNRDPQQSLALARESESQARAENYPKGLADALRSQISAQLELVQFVEAAKLCPEALELYEELNDAYGLGIVLNSMGVYHFRSGNYEKALDHLLKSLEKRQEAGDSTGMVSCKTNLGLVYVAMGQYDEGLREYSEAIEMNRSLNDLLAEARLLNNTGIAFSDRGEKDKAIDYFERSLAVKEKAGDRAYLYSSYYNIAELRLESGEQEKALEYFIRAGKLSEEFGNRIGTGVSLIGQAKIALQQKEMDKALELANAAMPVFEEQKSNEYMAVVHQLLHDIYSAENKPGEALAHFRKFHALREEIYKNEANQRIQNVRLQHDLESAQKQAELEKQKNEELQSAYSLIEEKNRQITDSINYSRRIQSSILPEDKYIGRLLEDYFILYLPKDIVSGDFYFIEPVRTNEQKELIAVAAADCTGHGVPGAFMSIFGYTYLSQSLKEKEVNSPGEALDFLNRRLGDLFRRSGDGDAIRDGMDIAFCVIDTENKKCWFAGANNPVWLWRDGAITETDGDKQPVGYYEHSNTFTNKTIALQENDCLYLFTDGYADQFGGPLGKKFKYKQLKELLGRIGHLPMREQKEKMQAAFDEWKGSLEQVDDVLVIGIKIK